MLAVAQLYVRGHCLEKRIIYVLGCGRSGSTILGFCLGNAENTLDLGEVIEFTRFNGRPNGFTGSTENYLFWDRVLASIEAKNGKIDFDRVRRLQKRFDKHHAIPLLFLPASILKPFGLSEYRNFLKSKYDGIFAQSNCAWFIDSSKYPSRLIHLREIYGTEAVKVIYLVRDPGGVAKAFQNSAQSTTKRFALSMTYYFVLNSFSYLVYFLTPSKNRFRIVYEELIQFPCKYLDNIGHQFQLDVDRLLEKIRKGLELQRGYIFNGNRMRIKQSVIFKKGTPKLIALPWHQSAISKLLKFLFIS